MTRVEDIHTALNSRLNTAESVPFNTEGKENIHRLILGKVLKMLGDDTALVQLGSTKIKAQLAAHQSRFFLLVPIRTRRWRQSE